MPPRTALITGGTSGIGKAAALKLHSRGARVAVTGHNPESLARAREELPDEIIVLDADSRSLEATDRVMDEVRSQFGHLNTLFLNAGIVTRMPLESWTESTYDDLFDINTKGSFFTLVKALPLLTTGASVILTAGILVSRGMAESSVTAGSRGALLAMLPSLALELAPRRIRVNAVSPGVIETPIWGKAGLAPDTVSDTLAAAAAGIPFDRVGTAEEVAETVAFLASDEASYITGQEIIVAGGMGLSA